MGWFWADSAPRRRPVAAHLKTNPDATPPPACPMHKASSAHFPLQHTSSLPVNAASCPVASPTASSNAAINPLNYMPSNLSHERSSTQKSSLPTIRTTSSIPRGDQESNWEYPSPQQMYNAMLRKGYDDTPEDAVESMVEVHNFLNEGAWNEIEAWEARFAGGLMEGWRACSRGEEGWAEMVLNRDWIPPEGTRPKLVRLMGRPNDMTPKARLHSLMAWVYPGKFAEEPPFDRHDWYVQRSTPAGQKTEVRYVIDYYSAPPEPTGEPVFYLDVRPAVDGPTAALERLIRSGRDIWFRGSGLKAREEAQRLKNMPGR